MKEAFASVITSASELIGTSKIHILFVLSLIAIIIINEKVDEKDKRRRINPTVFLLSLWGGVGYAVVSLFSGKKRHIYLIGTAFCLASIILSGNFVVSEASYENFSYYYGSSLMCAISAVAIAAYFIIYYFLAKQLFKTKSDKILFMIIALIMHLFDFYSVKASEFSIIISPASTKSIIIHGLMPFALWIYLKYEEKITAYLKPADDENDENDEEIPEEWDMKKHKILNIRNMAIAFIVFIVAFAASVFVINKKINSLYDATLLLENAANTKMTVDEIRDEFGMVAITVMISPEGSVTVVGAGPESVGEKCYETISKYSNKVDKWYILGSDEDDKAAYEFCKKQGIFVSETYEVKGIEKVE